MQDSDERDRILGVSRRGNPQDVGAFAAGDLEDSSEHVSDAVPVEAVYVGPRLARLARAGRYSR